SRPSLMNRCCEQSLTCSSFALDQNGRKAARRLDLLPEQAVELIPNGRDFRMFSAKEIKHRAPLYLPNPTAQNSSLRQRFLPLARRKLLQCNDMRMSIQGIPGASDRPANALNRKRGRRFMTTAAYKYSRVDRGLGYVGLFLIGLIGWACDRLFATVFAL